MNSLHAIEVAAAGIREETGCDGDRIAALIAAHPEYDPRELCSIRLGLFHYPFPSIDGNPPVFRDRPYFNAPRPA